MRRCWAIQKLAAQPRRCRFRNRQRWWSPYIYIYIYILLGVYTGDSVHAGNSESVPLLGVPTKSGVRTRSQKQRGRTGRVSPSPAILWLYTARISGDSIIPWNNMRLLASWRSIRWMCVVYLKPNWLPSELPVCIDFSSGTDSTLQIRMQEVLLDLWFLESSYSQSWSDCILLQALHFSVSSLISQFSFMITFVYGFNTISARWSLWRDLGWWNSSCP